MEKFQFKSSKILLTILGAQWYFSVAGRAVTTTQRERKKKERDWMKKRRRRTMNLFLLLEK